MLSEVLCHTTIIIIQFLNSFIHPNRNIEPMKHPLTTFSEPQTLASATVLSASIPLTALNISYRWHSKSHQTRAWLISLSTMSLRFTHAECMTMSSFLKSQHNSFLCMYCALIFGLFVDEHLIFFCLLGIVYLRAVETVADLRACFFF